MESDRTFRVMNILDDSDNESVAQEISMLLSAKRGIAIMKKVISIKW